MTALLQDPPPDLRVLREELAELRATHGRRSTAVRVAFERLVRAADAVGQPLDGLRRYTRDEVERFFAQTIPGPDGHVYWDGARMFMRNDGKQRVPRRWWYAHKHSSELDQYADLVPTCGESHCINPDHCEVGRGQRRMRFGRESMLGALRVAALRLGRTPTTGEWDTLGLSPTRATITARFGTWDTAVKEAGLPAVVPVHWTATPDRCIASLRFVHKATGSMSYRTFKRMQVELQAAGLPSSVSTIKRHLGSWNDALRKAGKR